MIRAVHAGRPISIPACRAEGSWCHPHICITSMSYLLNLYLLLPFLFQSSLFSSLSPGCCCLQLLKDTFTYHVVMGYAQLQRHRGLLAPLYCQPVGSQPGCDSRSAVLQFCKGICDRSLVVDDCIVAFMHDGRVSELGFLKHHCNVCFTSYILFIKVVCMGS